MKKTRQKAIAQLAESLVSELSPGYQVDAAKDLRAIEAALSSVVSGIQEFNETRRERDVFLMRLSALISALVTTTQQLALEGQNMVRDGGMEQELSEAEQAFSTLFRYADSSQRQQWDAAVDLLLEFPSLNSDQLYQAHQHAKEKRRLLLEYSFLGATELAELLPDKLSLGKNLSRTLARWVEEHQILGMQLKGSWKYPAIQINKQGEIYPKLPALIKKAVAAGYNHWEIMSWLVRPSIIKEDIAIGKPLQGFNRDTPVDELFKRAGDTAESERPYSDTPIHLLQTEQNDKLQQMAEKWLG